MIKITGTYFDGKSSRALITTATFDGALIRIIDETDNQLSYVSINDCKITPPLGNTRRSIILPDNARFESDNLESMAVLERALGANTGLRIVNFLESCWKTVVVCFVGLILFIWLFISYGIPMFAEKASRSVPPEMLNNVSMDTMKILDKKFFKPSDLPEDKTSEIKAIFKKLHAELNTGFNYQLEFRKSPKLGPNAFALPSGMIVMTDELVEIAENNIEITGILVHEIAHVEKRHSVRLFIQNTGVFLLISILAGDVTSITTMASTLPTLLVEAGYSQKFEIEADHEAGIYLIEQGLGTKSYQNILIRITKTTFDIPMSSVISTHPETKERVMLMKKLENEMDKKINSAEANKTRD